jgi:YidC/Oxa1 family membrane protein insertase
VDKKTLPIVVVLILVIVFWWDILGWLGLVKPAAPPAGSAAVDTTKVVPVDSIAKPAAVPATVAESTKVAATIVQPAEQIKPDTIIVNTKMYTVLLSTLGGGPVSIKLNDHKYRDGAPIEMLPDCKGAVPEVKFAAGTVSTTGMPFKASVAPGTYDASVQPMDLIFTYTSPEGGEVIRRYRFFPDRYDYQFCIEVNNREKLGFERLYTISWNCPLGVTEPNPTTDYTAMEAVAMMSGSRAKLADFKDDKLDQSMTGGTSWAGVRAKYFSAVLIPNRIADGVFAQGSKRKIETAKGRIEERKITAGLEMPFESVKMFADTFTVFVDPIDRKSVV